MFPGHQTLKDINKREFENPENKLFTPAAVKHRYQFAEANTKWTLARVVSISDDAGTLKRPHREGDGSLTEEGLGSWGSKPEPSDSFHLHSLHLTSIVDSTALVTGR